ncbi:MAG: hypothetical protein K0S33_62 [Bacteroidetes bacterium]|jgi:hypothetical protein|nr:hypothetical protein [Bacteroidota bacterium]
MRKSSFKKTVLLLLLFCLNCLSPVNAQPPGYLYYKTVNIDPAMVAGASDFTDFPVYITITNNDLRSSNGGYVASAAGTDIVFTGSDGTTIIPHELELYDPASGSLIVWVRVPLLKTDVSTVLYMYYGNSCAIVGSGSAWPSVYRSVLHLDENPATTAPQMKDSSPGTNPGTCYGSMNSSNSVAGKLSRAVSFDETDDHIRIPDFDYTASNAFSVSYWFYVPDNVGTSYQYMYSHGNYGVFNSLNTYFGEASLSITADQNMLKTVFQDNNDATNPNALDAGTNRANAGWHYYVFTVDAPGNPTVYIDGQLISNLSFQGGNSYNPATDIFLGGRSDLSSTRFYGGLLDELHILSAARSSDQILTEYNNQSAPSAFYSVSAQFTTSIIPCSPLPIGLISFTASILDAKAVKADWSTITETNNSHFIIQRSVDAINWTNLGQVPGIFYSNTLRNYEYIDHDPLMGIAYYRLKQVDVNGDYSYSEIESVNFEGLEIVTAYPNPSSGHFTVLINSAEAEQVFIELFSPMGQLLLSDELLNAKGVNAYEVDTKEYAPGIYLLRVFTKNWEFEDKTRVEID